METPIRVLQVVTHMNRGGLETTLMNYYRHMDRTIIQFDFLTHRPYDGDYGQEIKALGGIIYHLPQMNPLSREYMSALNRFFSEHQDYKIVHVHQDCMSSIILKVAKKNTIPVRIAHCHSSNQDKNLKYPIKRYYQTLIPKYATDLMSCGKAAGKWMFRGEPFIVLNNAIDVEQFVFSIKSRIETRKELGIKDDEFVIGHIGRFSPPKNHTFITDIFDKISVKCPTARLLFVGDDNGSIADEIKKKLKENRLLHRVIFTGLQKDVSKYLMAMDIFLFPSLYEGFPVTIVEAQAAGLPCLISDKVPLDCKITELVYQKKLTDSVDSWVASIFLLGSKKERKNMKKEIVEAGFDIVSNAQWLKCFYYKKIENILKGDNNGT